MGRRSCPKDRVALDRRVDGAPGIGRAAARFIARTSSHACLARFCLLFLVASTAGGLATFGVERPVFGQTLADKLVKKPTNGQPDKMFVEADQLVYDTVKDTVAAQGNARVYYQGRVLEADKVTYDRKTGRVLADGHAKLTERDGTVLHGTEFDLTDDFRDGFIESLRADTPQRTHFSAPRVERIGGDTTVFDKGTYSACDACKDTPDKPRLWRVRAKRIIHKNDEQMIYYEDASLEFLGIPVAYVPFFSAPDPSVTRKSGILAPHYLYKSALGFGLGIPIFWALAPNYDLTVTPTAFSKQGFFGSAEFRHRLENGSYYVRATGIAQQQPGVFGQPPYGAGDRTFRGSFESKGQFKIADKWKAGWEFTVLSDKHYLYDYSVSSQNLSSNYFSEVTSSIYLTGQGDRGFFDLHGYYFEGLSSHDFQPQQPVALPVLDYNKTFDLDPAKTAGIGGQLDLDFNFTNLTASAASFQSVGPRTLDNAYNLYDVCTNYTPGRTNGSCLLRGIGGSDTRATIDATWKRKFIDPIGSVWTAYAFARVNGEDMNLNTSRSYTFASTNGMSTYSNASQTAFTGGVADSAYVNANPGVALEYRYPLFTKTSFGSVVVEPIAQLVARPNNQLGSRPMINLDAQSLVFDDTTLFQLNKYSGYDRFETGTRANYGGQVTFNFNNGGYANIIGGQSYQVAGTNSYATPDAANVGLSSGLDTRRSDYVGAFTISPGPVFAFTAKGRFDEATFEPRRIDLIATANLGALTGGVQFANYQSQPVIGYDVRREGLAVSAKYKFSPNYFAQGNVTFDMSRHLYPASVIGYTDPGLFSVASLGLGAGYTDECTTFSFNYSSMYQDNGSGSLVRNQTFLVTLQLRTLGDAKFSQSILANAPNAFDGVK